MCECEFIYGITILFFPGEAGVQRLVYIYIQDKLGIVTRKSILHTCGAQGRVGLTRRRRGGVKRTIKERSVSSISTQSSSDSSSSSDESDTLCSICHQRKPEPIAKRRIGKKNQSEWVCCDKCCEWVHCYCADVTLRPSLLHLSLVISAPQVCKILFLVTIPSLS